MCIRDSFNSLGAGFGQSQALQYAGEPLVSAISGSYFSVGNAVSDIAIGSIHAGMKVRYSGRLYSESRGGRAGKRVNGIFTVSRVISGRAHGVLLDNGLGWVSIDKLRIS